MYKALLVIALISIGCTSANTRKISLKPNSHIHRVASSTQKGTNGLDWCPQCIDTFDDLLQLVLDAVLNYGVLGTCADICDFVAEKSGSELLGFICTFGCSILGIEEFVKLVDKADLDPIYYCETIKLCPINDNGDAKFKSFTILPPRGPTGTTFSIDYVFVSNNGTGTGEIVVTIKTVDKIPLSAGLLLEAQKPGTYGERVTLDATPDPDCDPTQDECEQWLPGTYAVSVFICNGQCGSHHPHTQLYDTAQGTFVITE